MSDVEAFRHKLIYCLGVDEKVEADDGYEGLEKWVRLPFGPLENAHRKAVKSIARHRHESV